ncbi:carboxypeptidase-like regulatory domain-containing protein [uncultured Psychroserpens sp.]|uniref:carboxypeptidase-like regulatory domain-containing protein n=1 Tax=uncultured Psychroserpens sp. TaxID=255436 RepID=UPI00260856F4|nr:carboxypeptidase-like regulatory domain-containing protein [uncultured Psychroserpens sp.]
MKRYLTLIAVLTIAYISQAQNLTAKIIDATTKEPIPFVAVQTAKYKGVISNDDGIFIINIEDTSSNQITLSCLGYNTLTVSIDDLKASNFLLMLQPATNELDTIYLSNTRPNVDSIVAKVNRNLVKNYRTDSLKYSFFYRETSYIDFKNLDFEVKKASHFKKRQLVDANDNLRRMSDEIMTSNYVNFTDITGDLLILNPKKKKLTVEKATKIVNSKKDFSIDKVQEKAQNIVLKYLDTTKTYKLKTGLFKIEDSLSLVEKDSDKGKNEFELKNLKSRSASLLSQLGSNGILKTILNTDDYEYTLENITFNKGEMIYSILFEPRRSRAKFTGRIYVSDDTYAILKLDYRYSEGKRGDKLNLRLILGVKYIENVNQGTIIYRENDLGFYEPRYIKSESGEYFYVHRPLKFIENSSERNKTAFDFKIEGNTKGREELLLSSVTEISASDFEAASEAKKVPYESLRKYDATIWTGKETLAPTNELKMFEVKDEE